MKRITRLPMTFLSLLGLLSIALLLLYKLNSLPHLTWDEGWTVDVARNWVVNNHYGHYQSGEPSGPDLAASMVTVLPVAVSFKLLGVGIWQARLPMVILTLIFLAQIFFIARQLFSFRIAIASVIYLLLLPVSDQFHPLIFGRQVLGEMPSLVLLLEGVICLPAVLRGRNVSLILVGAFWGLALHAKAQILPFWAGVLLLTSLYAWILQDRKSAARLLLIGIITFLFYRGIGSLTVWILGDSFIPSEAAPGLFSVTALVWDPEVRLRAVFLALTFGLPVLVGLLHRLLRVFDRSYTINIPGSELLTQVALFALTGIWMGWFILLGMAWTRYLLPAIYLGSIFFVAWLDEWTQGFNFQNSVDRLSSLLKSPLQKFTSGLKPLVAGFIILYLLSFTWISIRSFSLQSVVDEELTQVAKYINGLSGSGVVETYDPQVLFLLEKPYHYPPIWVHVQLNRWAFIDMDTEITYDPKEYAPEYILVGPSGEEWGLYDDLISSDEYRYQWGLEKYALYRRINN